MTTSLTGLNAAEAVIDVVGNNMANSNTVGFKASNAVFASQFLQNLSLGAAPTDISGGTNPRQIGLGTRIAEIAPNFTQGTIEASASPSDLAIQGDGFFIVEGPQGEQFFTRNGQFKTNANKELVTITGHRILGFGVDEDYQIQQNQLQPLTIPIGASVAQDTRNVFLEGTLRPDGELADTPAIIESAKLSDGSLEVPPNLTAMDLNAVNAPDISGVTVTPDAAPGSITAGTYRYRLVFVDGDGNEGAPSVDVGPITSTGTPGVDQSIQLNSLPPADGVTFVARNLYRTSASGTGPYQFVSSINATDTVYTDSVGDAGLPGGTLQADTLVPGNYSYHVTFYNSATGLESRPTALVGPVSVTVTGRRIRLDNLPQPTTSDFDSVRLYRNPSTDDQTFYRVAELSGGQSSFIDGILDANLVAPGNEINLDGPPINFGMNLVNLVRRDDSGNYVNVFQEGTLQYTPNKGHRDLGTKDLPITASTTVQDLISFMEDAMGIQELSSDPNFPIPGNPGGSVTGQSQIQFVSNMGIDNALSGGLFELVDTSGVVLPVDLPFAEVQAANGESASTEFLVYDTLGIPINVRLTSVMESRTDISTTYRWFAESRDNQPATGVDISVGTGVITFDEEGNVSFVSDSTVSVLRQQVSSASPLQFEVDFSQLSGLAEQSRLNASRQDGSPPGNLSSFVISEGGVIRGTFSNGVTRDLGQIRLVRFANNAGLEQLGENLFGTGENSGLPVQGNPGEQGIGSVTAGAVELSNTDIGQNLIDLILASTQYRGGTRVITAVQQLFDELLNLRR
jgi:flagellar hook protein FlgE